MTVHFSGCILAHLSLPYSATWPVPKAGRRDPNPARHAAPAGTGAAPVVSLEGAASPEEGAASPDFESILIHRGTAASLRNMMGVFPLADTMIFLSNSPSSRGGNTRASNNGRVAGAWWHAHPTSNPHRATAAARSPIRYIPSIANPQVLSRCPGTDPSSRVASAGRYIRRSPTVHASNRTVGSLAERGPPSATSRMPC